MCLNKGTSNSVGYHLNREDEAGKGLPLESLRAAVKGNHI